MPKLLVSALLSPPPTPSNGVGWWWKGRDGNEAGKIPNFLSQNANGHFLSAKGASIFVRALDTWWFRGENVGKSGGDHDESNQIRASKS